MPELGEDLATRLMDGAGNLFPAGNLLGRVDSGSTDVTDPLWAHLRPLGNDQTRRGPLYVVGNGQRIRDVAGKGAAAGHRRHYHAVGEIEAAQSVGRKQIHGHSFHSCQSAAKGLSMTYSQVPSGWRRTTSAARPERFTRQPPGAVPTRLQSDRTRARSPVSTTLFTSMRNSPHKVRRPCSASRMASLPVANRPDCGTSIAAGS